MANRKPTRLEMLTNYAALLRVDFERKASEWRERVVPHTAAGLAAWEAETAALKVEAAYLDDVLKEAHRGMLETFFGTWPSADPLSLALQWCALLDDMDQLPSEYLGEDAAAGDSPMFTAWNELNGALHALDPQAPGVAAAILITAERDLAAGYGMDWEDEELELARANAGPPPPRPR